MDRVRTRWLLSDAVTGAVGGYVGLGVMDLVTSRVYTLASQADKDREAAVSPGVAYAVAARKSAAVVGVALTDDQAKAVGSAFHYAIGIGWAPVYPLLRRLPAMPSLAAGLLTGLGLWAVFDEGLVPSLGLSAPNSAYPLSTHLRGFFGHLSYGLTVMTVVEAARLG